MCHNFFHFVGVERPGTSDDSGLNSTPHNCTPCAEFSNVSKLEYVCCFQYIFGLLLVVSVYDHALLVHFFHLECLFYY